MVEEEVRTRPDTLIINRSSVARYCRLVVACAPCPTISRQRAVSPLHLGRDELGHLGQALFPEHFGPHCLTILRSAQGFQSDEAFLDQWHRGVVELN